VEEIVLKPFPVTCQAADASRSASLTSHPRSLLATSHTEDVSQAVRLPLVLHTARDHRVATIFPRYLLSLRHRNQRKFTNVNAG